MATKTDPVCKMDVDTKNTREKSQYKGQTYHFCGSECRQEFEKKPEQYVGGTKKETSGHPSR